MTHPYIDALVASGIDPLFLENLDNQHGRAEAFSTKNAKRAAGSLAESYEDVLRRFQSPEAFASKEAWAEALRTLQPELEAHLRTVATNSWRGRGLPLPSAAQRERYVQLAAKRALGGLNDIRRRYQSATEGKPNRQSPAEYIKRAEQTAASIADRAQDYLYQSYEKVAYDQGAIVEKVWRNSNNAKSRHRRMENKRAVPGTNWIDPQDGKPIVPRQPRGGQAEFSGSNAQIKYILKNGKEV